MSLKIKWLEEKASGYTDEIPDQLFANEGLFSRTSHDVTGPKGKTYCAWCDVKTAGTMVLLDYEPYKENEKEFYMGTLRLTFGDAKRTGVPKVAWRDASSQDFKEIEATVTRAQEDASPGPISEKKVDDAYEPFNPSNLVDARQKALASLAVRQGQPKFRNELKAAYENTCALTGYSVVEVLEAAHIIPYRGKDTNHVQNGLLLRADIHRLFDMGLIGIDPSTWKVVLCQRLQNGPYHELHGSTPRLPKKESERPSSEALEQHLEWSKLKK